MAWTKIPREHHPIFEAALPVDKRIKSVKMFGGICVMVNGNMAGGLWAESIMVRLPPADYKRAMKLAGTTDFDPMGRGKPMSEMVVLPSSVMKSMPKLKQWLERAIEYTGTLPPKKKKPAAKKKKKKTFEEARRQRLAAR